MNDQSSDAVKAPQTSQRTIDTHGRCLERVVGPKIAEVVRLRRLNLDKAQALRRKGANQFAMVWEDRAESCAHEACDLLEALRPNDQAQARRTEGV